MSAREASRVMMDRVCLPFVLGQVGNVEVLRLIVSFSFQPLPSPVKQPAAHRKSASKAKPPSRAGAAQAPRFRGLPQAVLRRIKINLQALPALDEIDDDDPIDFLR